MSRADRYRLIDELTATGGTIRDLQRRRPNYSELEIQRRLDENKKPLKFMERTFEQVFTEHTSWTAKQFPKGTSIGALIHASREANEVIHEIKKMGASDDPMTSRPKLVTEYADMMGCITDSFTREGITLQEVVDAWYEKLQVNKARQWKDNGDGSYSHVK